MKEIVIKESTWIRLNEACSNGELHNKFLSHRADEYINDVLDDLEELREEINHE